MKTNTLENAGVAGPSVDPPASNAGSVRLALEFLRRVVQARLEAGRSGEAVRLPDEYELVEDHSALGDFIRERRPSVEEYVILVLALAPHVRPELLDEAVRDGLPESGDFPQVGGTRDTDSRAFIPTGETALFILAGADLQRRFELQRLLASDHWLAREGIVRLEPSRPGAPYWSGRLLVDAEHIERFTAGRVSSPAFSPAFPARAIRTDLAWSELVLGAEVKAQIDEIKRWIEHCDILLDGWNMRRKLSPGYRALFHGAPGTGKTLTATLLGKHTGRTVFSIDLSTVVSKYIGETEKNLASLFDKAQHKRWILFFDEADALFGKRTGVRDAHDRYANQEVSYLLQRVEAFDGLVILASNFKGNMDEAFLRRFNAIIRFPFPDEAERAAIWRLSLPACARFEEGVDLPEILAPYELTGGSIINVVQHASIEAIARRTNTITLADARQGIRREFEKEGKVLPGT